MARTVTALSRLLDVVALTGPDRRIQTFFTIDPAPAFFDAGLLSFVDKANIPLLPWETAVRQRFDLALAASENDSLGELRAPVLLVPHGFGFEKYYPGTKVVAGLDPDKVAKADQIALSHPRQADFLSTETATKSTVVGDPTLDRMLASEHRIPALRKAYGAQGKTLVVLASTWGPDSLLGKWPDLPDRLAATLPIDEYRLVVLMHPGIWAVHGPWQVQAWLSRATQAGVRVIGPSENWQSALAAASVVISDHGSTALYAAALDKPLLLAAGGSTTTVAGSPTEMLRERAATFDGSKDLKAQLESAVTGLKEVAALAVHEPGNSAHHLGRLLYRMLNLPLPAEPLTLPPVAMPDSTADQPATLIAGATVNQEGIAMVRYPDIRRLNAYPEMDFRHLIADPRLSSLPQVSSASVLSIVDTVSAGWNDYARTLLRQWPQAQIVASVTGETSCRVYTRDGAATLHASGPHIDPMVLASLAYVRLCQAKTLSGHDTLYLGGHVIEVELAAD